jgi:hypothetical protein
MTAVTSLSICDLAGAELADLTARGAVPIFFLVRLVHFTPVGRFGDMAQKVVTHYTDDLDGKDIKPGKGGEVRFSIDSASYVIDLSDANRRKLEDALAPFIAAARRDRGRSGRVRKPAQSGISAAELRDWARQNGFEVPERGRIPAEIREAYDARS